jgi:putative component of membrane protein insertase Oxa1/YidC/SpoIIIJ protein YidD
LTIVANNDSETGMVGKRLTQHCGQGRFLAVISYVRCRFWPTNPGYAASLILTCMKCRCLWLTVLR